MLIEGVGGHLTEKHFVSLLMDAKPAKSASTATIFAKAAKRSETAESTLFISKGKKIEVENKTSQIFLLSQ